MFKTIILLAIFMAAGPVTAQAQSQNYGRLANSAHLTQAEAAGLTLDEIAEAKRLSEGNANN